MNSYLCLIAGAAVQTLVTAETPCCQGKCAASGHDKYWSVTKLEDGAYGCSEMCLTSMEYDVIHVVERSLALSTTGDSPCAGLGYPNYYKTTTHGYGPATVNWDLYNRSALHEFERGVMAALGYTDGEECFDSARDVTKDVWRIAKELRNGTAVQKAKALAQLAAETKTIVETLEQCSSATTDLEKYAALVKILKDPRFYTLHNALTLALNLAEDRKMLETFVADIKGNDYFGAGKELILTVLDVISRPGIPDSNGTAAVQISTGIAEGLGESVSIPCFADARVEFPAVIGGVMECLTGVGMIQGLESLFHGIEGIVPTFEDCMHDRKEIMSLLKGFGLFKDPHGLARQVVQNMVNHGIDIAVLISASVLAAKGQEWHTLGEDIGKILGEIAFNNTQDSFNVIV